MKVCLAALIPLLACLLVLPSDVSGRRRLRQERKEKEDEYEVSHIRKRSMKLSEHFKGDNLAKSCSVCRALYDIDEANCVSGKKKAKYNCLVKAKENKDAFMAKFHESESPSAPAAAPAPAAAAPAPAAEPAPAAAAPAPAAEPAPAAAAPAPAAEPAPAAAAPAPAAEPAPAAAAPAPAAEPAPSSGGGGGGGEGGGGGGDIIDSIGGENGGKVMYLIKAPILDGVTKPPAPKRPENKEDYFKPEYVQITCKTCRRVANVNYLECIKPEENHDNKCCKHVIDAAKSKFDTVWDKNPERRRRAFRRRKSRV